MRALIINIVLIVLFNYNSHSQQNNYTQWPLCSEFKFNKAIVDNTSNINSDIRSEIIQKWNLDETNEKSFQTITDFENSLVGITLYDEQKHLLLRYSEKVEEPIEINTCYGDNESSEVSIFHDGIDIKGWGKPVVAAFSTTTNNLTFIGRKQAGKSEQNASRRKPVGRSIFCS